MEWSDLRVFLAIAREGTLGGAARKLHQSQPTMGRRLRALERALDQTLFQRTDEGFVLTDEGSAVLSHVERIEEEALAFQRRLAGQDKHFDGMLRIASSDWFGAHLLAPVLAEFAAAQPRVLVELLTSPRNYSLSRREADMAFRIRPFAEPDVVSRRLMRISYGVYLRSDMKPPRAGDGAGTRVITMDTASGAMPEVVWLKRILPKAQVVSRSSNRDVHARLCADGVGIALLPTLTGDALAGIERIDLGEDPPGCEVWVGYHRDQKRLARLRALLDLVIARLAN